MHGSFINKCHLRHLEFFSRVSLLPYIESSRTRHWIQKYERANFDAQIIKLSRISSSHSFGYEILSIRHIGYSFTPGGSNKLDEFLQYSDIGIAQRNTNLIFVI